MSYRCLVSLQGRIDRICKNVKLNAVILKLPPETFMLLLVGIQYTMSSLNTQTIAVFKKHSMLSLVCTRNVFSIYSGYHFLRYALRLLLVGTNNAFSTNSDYH